MRPPRDSRERVADAMVKLAVEVEDMSHLVAAFAGEQKLEVVLGALLAKTCALTGAAGGAVLLLDAAARHLHAVVIQHESMVPAQLSSEAVGLYDGTKPNLTEPHAFAALTGNLVNIPDVYRYSGFELDPLYEADRLNRRRSGSLIVAPIRFADEFTVGVLRLTDLADANSGKPCGLPDALRPLVQSVTTLAAAAVRQAGLKDENRRLTQHLERLTVEIADRDDATKMKNAELASLGAATKPVGSSPAFRSAVNLVARAATSRVPVLLLGETGTGKEVFSRAIHALSGRPPQRFVVQNCAALPETLLESELFGHKKGAFTGAVQDKVGLVQEADKGTLFLDEIGDMPFGLQAKLLRFLQEGEVRPLGDTKSAAVDVRIIAATNADLQRAMEKGTFRSDLYYRLSVFPITLPPLRERPSDIPALIESFLDELARRHGRRIPAMTPRAADALLRWRYPGNVRELKNIIERALLLVDEGERIDLPHLPAEIGGAGASVQLAPIPDRGDLRTIMRRYESIVIEAKLREAGGNRSRAASLLNISRRSLQTKLRLHMI
ncbi:MAG: sigma 54-interacting transcriptional regulator [Ancalomicrobiaceae bacterium]|nr:sigma 54-interacting transcriptional regulator [Ancalomicrobiaceae bacterium]